MVFFPVISKRFSVSFLALKTLKTQMRSTTHILIGSISFHSRVRLSRKNIKIDIRIRKAANEFIAKRDSR